MAETVPVVIDNPVAAAFPQVRVLALRAAMARQEALAPGIAALAPEFDRTLAQLAAVEQISALDEIAPWRRAYGRLGVKPSKFPSSIEALLRRAQKGRMAATGIPAVDLYNTISVIYRAPFGAYDMGRLSASPIALRLARPNLDSFTPLGGRAEEFPLNPALVVYAQDDRILCWGFNTRDSQHSAVGAGSTDIAFFSELVEDSGRANAIAALTRLAEILVSCGARVANIVEVSAASPASLLPAAIYSGLPPM